MLDNIYLLSDYDICKRIGARLKAARLRQDITREKLADDTRISVSSIARIEGGEIKSFDSLLRLIRILGLLDILVPLAEEEPLSPNEIYELQNKLVKKRRKRASRSRAKNNDQNKTTW